MQAGSLPCGESTTVMPDREDRGSDNERGPLSPFSVYPSFAISDRECPFN